MYICMYVYNARVKINMAAPDFMCKMCTCQVCRGVQDVLANIFRILKLYGHLLDSYIVDFFQDDLWSKLPKSWQTFLRNITPEELGSWILSDYNHGTKVWPLSLIALRKCIKILTINRDPNEESKYVCRSFSRNDEFVNYLPSNDNNGRMENIEKHYSRHIKAKKSYEIQQYSQICIECTQLAKCQCIVDIGAGMGHLARKLFYKYNLPIICVEQNKSLSESAKKHDEEFVEKLKKQVPEFSNTKPYHFCTTIDKEENDDGIYLTDKFHDIFATMFKIKDRGFGLSGLHPCGDLASTLLKLYVKQDTVKFITIVGCCYMKLTVNSDNRATSGLGYPLSKYLTNSKISHSLSYAALEVACHALENYCDKMKNSQYNDLKVHAYRATLEMILIKKGGTVLRHGRVGSVKVRDQMTFDQYCKLATNNLNEERQVTNSDINDLQALQCLNRWREVVAFEAIRLMLAPLVETVVLLDRFLYLSENNLKPMIKTIFDPRRSARNFVLISIKK